MKHEIIMERLKKLEADYKKVVDDVIKENIIKKRVINDSIDIYSSKKIAQDLERVNEISKSKIDVARDKYKPLIDYYLDLHKKNLDKFFNGTLDAELSNKAQTFKAVGVELSQREFDALMQSAKSYYDLRVLGQLADDMHLDFSVKNNEVFSDIDRAYKYFEDYKNVLTSAINYYAGENAELKDFLPPDTMGNKVESYVPLSASTYFETRASENAFDDFMTKVYSILPEYKVKNTLTEKDRALIDSIIDPKYPSLAKTQIKAICGCDDNMAELFSLDERYSEYVNEYYAELERG